MKRFLTVMICLTVLLLGACAAQRTDTRAEGLQRRYAAMSGCTARVTVSTVGETETRRYVLALSRSECQTHVTVVEPETLSGVSAVVGDGDALSLEFDGMVLDAGSLDPEISAVNAADILFHAAAEGWVTERNDERFEDVDALRLCFETEHAGEKLLVTAWFDADDAPLYAEIERGGEILAYLQFTDFQFCDILPDV